MTIAVDMGRKVTKTNKTKQMIAISLERASKFQYKLFSFYGFLKIRSGFLFGISLSGLAPITYSI